MSRRRSTPREVPMSSESPTVPAVSEPSTEVPTTPAKAAAKSVPEVVGESPKPSRGRVVFYTLPEKPGVLKPGEEAMAYVVGVNQGGTVNLAVFPDVGQIEDYDPDFMRPMKATSVPFNADPKVSSTWRWPPRT